MWQLKELKTNLDARFCNDMRRLIFVTLYGSHMISPSSSVVWTSIWHADYRKRRSGNHNLWLAFYCVPNMIVAAPVLRKNNSQILVFTDPWEVDRAYAIIKNMWNFSAANSHCCTLIYTWRQLPCSGTPSETTTVGKSSRIFGQHGVNFTSFHHNFAKNVHAQKQKH